MILKFFSTYHYINASQVNDFTTASNPENPFKVKQLIKFQQRDELQGGYKSHISNIIDEHKFEEPYLKVREKIIRSMDFSVAMKK